MLPGDQGTLGSLSDGTFVNHPTKPDYDGTMLQYEDGTMLNHGTMLDHGEDGTMLNHGSLESRGEGVLLRHGDTSSQPKKGPGSAISR